MFNVGYIKNIFLTVSFVMCCYFTVYIVMPKKFWIMWCKKISSLLKRDVRISQILYTHIIRLVGMSSKMRYFLQVSTLVSVQNLLRDPIDGFPDERRALML